MCNLYSNTTSQELARRVFDRIDDRAGNVQPGEVYPDQLGAIIRHDGDGFELVPSAPTLDVFGLLGRVAGELETGGRSGAQIAQANLHALTDVDTVMGRLLTARSAAGEALNRIDRVTGQLDERKLNAEVERSAAEDLDPIEAISTFSARQTGYDAALKSYAMVQRLSLFQYLNV